MSKGGAIVPASTAYFKFKLLRHIIYVMARTAVPASKHLVSRAGGVIGPVLKIDAPTLEIMMFIPWPPETSSHP